VIRATPRAGDQPPVASLYVRNQTFAIPERVSRKVAESSIATQ
jgi:hypothetical protein